MRQLLDTVWQRRGISWLWDAEALIRVANANEAWSLRQFLRTAGKWPIELPSNSGKTLVVAGLEAVLDLLSPDDAAAWLENDFKAAILAFQDEWGSDAALIFWLPGAGGRIAINSATDAVMWRCAAPHSNQQIDFGRILWGEAAEYPQEIALGLGIRSSGLFHLRIT